MICDLNMATLSPHRDLNPELSRMLEANIARSAVELWGKDVTVSIVTTPRGSTR